MAFKRKRTCSLSSPMSISSFRSASTPEAQSPTPMPSNFDHDSMDLDMVSPSRPSFVSTSMWARQHADGSYLNARSRKRFRDNRPDERAIHENTIQKLFQAQRVQPHASPIASVPLQSDSLHQRAPAPVQKSTLHSFWKIATPPVQQLPPTIHVQHFQDTPRCEDCDATLENSADGMEIDGNVEGGAVINHFACCGCGRRVCGTCAVVADERTCLQCVSVRRSDGRWW